MQVVRLARAPMCRSRSLQPRPPKAEGKACQAKAKPKPSPRIVGPLATGEIIDSYGPRSNDADDPTPVVAPLIFRRA